MISTGYHTRGQGRFQLVGLLCVVNHQGVQVLGAAHLELGVTLVLLDGDVLGVLAAHRHQKVLNLVQLLRLQIGSYY